MPLLVFSVLLFLGGCSGISYATLGCHVLDHRSARFDKSDYHEVFRDDFDANSLVEGEERKWWANLHSSFGKSLFVNYGDHGIYSVADGNLRIGLKYIDGNWYSGIVQSMNLAGRGFAESNGYFEARMRFPIGRGIWPAFWLMSESELTSLADERAEIDIVEAYGNSKSHHSSLHLWRPRDRKDLPNELWKLDCPTAIKDTLFDGHYHTYGALLTSDEIQIFVDGYMVKRVSRSERFRKKFYILLDLGVFDEKWLDEEKNYQLEIDYVSVMRGRDAK